MQGVTQAELKQARLERIEIERAYATYTEEKDE